MPGSLSQLIKKDHFFEAQITKKQKVTEVLKSDRRGLKYSVIKKERSHMVLLTWKTLITTTYRSLKAAKYPKASKLFPTVYRNIVR